MRMFFKDTRASRRTKVEHYVTREKVALGYLACTEAFIAILRVNSCVFIRKVCAILPDKVSVPVNLYHYTHDFLRIYT